MLLKIKERLNLGEYETNLLSEFSEKVLKEALKIYEAKKGVSHPFKFVLGCCNKIQEKEKTKSQNKQTGPITQKPWLPTSLNPWQHFTFEDNLKRWEEYEDSKEVVAYVEEFGKVTIDKQKLTFMQKLNKMELPQTTTEPYTKKISFEDKLTAQEIAKEIKKIDSIDASKMYGGEGYKNRLLFNWANKDYVPCLDEEESLKYIDDMRKRVGLEPRNVVKFEPESNTLNDTTSEQLNTQVEEKDSSELNVVRIYKPVEPITIPKSLDEKRYEECKTPQEKIAFYKEKYGHDPEAMAWLNSLIT